MAAEVFQSIAVKGIYGSGSALRIGNGSPTRGLVSQNDLFVTGKLEVDGYTNFDSATYFYSSLIATANLYIGGSSNTFPRLEFSTAQTPDALTLGAGSLSNSIIISEVADMITDFAHALQTNPTIFIQSADATDITQWISFAHDQTDATINWGTGNLNLEGATHTGTGDVAINGYVTISVAGVAKKFATVA